MNNENVTKLVENFSLFFFFKQFTGEIQTHFWRTRVLKIQTRILAAFINK